MSVRSLYWTDPTRRPFLRIYILYYEKAADSTNCLVSGTFSILMNYQGKLRYSVFIPVFLMPLLERDGREIRKRKSIELQANP